MSLATLKATKSIRKTSTLVLVLALGLTSGCAKSEQKIRKAAHHQTSAGSGNTNSGGVAPVDLGVCDGVSCSLAPITKKTAVTTILMALGDEANSQLVVNGASSQLIAEAVIRYTSPEHNPKILLVRDRQFNGEDPEDTLYIQFEMLKRYEVTYIEEPEGGLRATDLEGFDLVWFNNPGHPMSSVASRDALLAFAGAVVLQGDDLTRGNGFSTEELTGLHFVDNGTDVVCDGQSYGHDNNYGSQYRVTLDSERIIEVDENTIAFRYGNDIDNSTVARDGLEILASAKGGPETCNESRPAIVRYTK